MREQGEHEAGAVRRPLQISATDVAQFIRFEQCERYLRLRLDEQSQGSRFLRDYGVMPQTIPPLLTRSGASFEKTLEAAIAARLPTQSFAQRGVPSRTQTPHNQDVVRRARGLAPGQAVVLFQTRLHVQVQGWLLRGVVDLLRLERDHAGALRVLIADMKSSSEARVEHRLQVAFYHEMLRTLFAHEGVDCAEIALGVLYRGPADPGEESSPPEAARRAAQHAAAEMLFGAPHGLLEIVADAAGYIAAVGDLVTSQNSTAARVANAEFAAVPYHLTYKCDGCLFNEYCMKWSAAHDDLSLLPHLTAWDKSALRHAGVTTTRELAALKEFAPPGSADNAAATQRLVPAPGKHDLARLLAGLRPLGARLDELVHRARRYHAWKGDDLTALSYIPSKGYGSLPYCDATHNPNLVRVYIDAQHDYLQDRIYLLGALVVACENGQETPTRRRAVVRLTDGPPETAEQEEALFVDWVRDTIGAIVQLAAPDAQGQPSAPVHLIFFDSVEQRLLLEGLARHFQSVLGAAPLYDFVTQLAAFDSPMVTFLDREIAELKNYPMLCQSLQAVAAYLKFDWNEGVAYRRIFRARLFDFWGKLDDSQGQPEWYTSRARFSSQLPLEYAYAAWGELTPPQNGARDEFAAYRAATPALLRGFHGRRLEALERITHDFSGNKQTEKSAFRLPDLHAFSGVANSLAVALDEFLTIERHVELGGWKAARLAPPERRALAGNTTLARYQAGDQAVGVAERNAENLKRQRLKETYEREYRAEHPGAARVTLTKARKEATKWSHGDTPIRLCFAPEGLDCAPGEALALCALQVGDRVALSARLTTDSRLDPAQQHTYTPTPKQLLYATRADVVEVVFQRDAAGQPLSGHVDLRIAGGGGNGWRGYAFGGYADAFADGQLYALDPDPNDWYGYFLAKVVEGLRAGGANTLYHRMTDPAAARVTWPVQAREGQARFLQGLVALHEAGAFHALEASKHAYIGGHGDAPLLLVQGPPGTGKSYASAFALLARLQGAMTAGQDLRAFVTCKTHAATDVLLGGVAAAQDLLRRWQAERPAVFATYFDARLLDTPLYRFAPRPGAAAQGIVHLYKKGAAPDDAPRDAPLAVDALLRERWCVVGATPGGAYRMIKDAWDNDLFGHELCHCLILDEASQMNLPEAMMAALPLAADGQIIVVGDHRQMPPIVKHDWANEVRRTFQQFRAYESLFASLLPLAPPMIKFEESFRLHQDMAAFLSREIYQQDGINYYSRKTQTLPVVAHADPFVHGVLGNVHPLVVVVHDEATSQLRNPFEQALITPLLEALAGPPYDLGPDEGLGVVAPHNLQRVALRAALPCLSRLDPTSGAVEVSAVDTVERFQGGERAAIVVGATESDRAYLLTSGDFLLDPRRLTVALSRAKHKMILVASRSVFEVFSPDDEIFHNAQLWKNLLRHTCTTKLWEGDQHGHHVVVWGNTPDATLVEPKA